MMKASTILLSLLVWARVIPNVFAANSDGVSATGIQGYNVVSYHNAKHPLRGNGHFLSVHDGSTFLFSTAGNKAEFDSNPAKYAPAFEGYCAFGVSVGKKFVGDPEVWRIVDGKLYLNLDTAIQSEWLKDVPDALRPQTEPGRKSKTRQPRSCRFTHLCGLSLDTLIQR